MGLTDLALRVAIGAAERAQSLSRGSGSATPAVAPAWGAATGGATRSPAVAEVLATPAVAEVHATSRSERRLERARLGLAFQGA